MLTITVSNKAVIYVVFLTSSFRIKQLRLHLSGGSCDLTLFRSCCNPTGFFLLHYWWNRVGHLDIWLCDISSAGAIFWPVTPSSGWGPAVSSLWSFNFTLEARSWSMWRCQIRFGPTSISYERGVPFELELCLVATCLSHCSYVPWQSDQWITDVWGNVLSSLLDQFACSL
jgi:hypothetical protein